jgi:hypothetical protein
MLGAWALIKSLENLCGAIGVEFYLNVAPDH